MSRAADWFVVAFGGTILAASLALAILAGRGVDPIANLDLCWSRVLLHRDCPGCGLTRSFVALAGGKLARAFACNPTGPLLFGAVLLSTVLHAIRLAGAPLRRIVLLDSLLWGTAMTTLLVHAVHFYSS